MYSDLVNNLKDRVIDGAIDSTLTSFKDNQILNKTFVWTAISKETYSGKIAYIVFINKNMYRRRVQYDQLGEFCRQNYVSNVIVNEGKVSMVGITFNDLPDISGYSRSRYTEQEIYNKAMPYIQSTERKIYEDFDMKCLKGHENDGEVKSNFSSNLSNIKDIAQAGAITAVTAAGSAAVAGIGVGVAKAYQAVNKKKLTEIQMDLLKQLYNCYNMTEELIKIKQITNNKLQQNKNVLAYNNSLDAENDLNGKLRALIMQHGVNGCIARIESLTQQYVAKATSNKILDMPFNNKGNKAGTIGAYSNNILSRVTYLKQLHETTKQLIDNNIKLKREQEQAEAERRFLESQQGSIINELNSDLNNLEEKIMNYDPDLIGDNNISEKYNEFLGLNLDMTAETTGYTLEQVMDNSLKLQYSERLSRIKYDINSMKTRYNSRVESVKAKFKNDIIRDINSTDNLIERLIAGDIGGDDYVNTISTVNNNITTIRMKIGKLSEQDKNTLKTKLDNLENKLESNRHNLKHGADLAEKDANKINEIKLLFSRTEVAINGCSETRYMSQEVTTFMSRANNELSYIKNNALAVEWRHKILEKKNEFNELIEQKKLEENQAKNQKEQVKKDLTNEIRQKTADLKLLNVKGYSTEDLENFESEEDYYQDKIDELNLDWTESKTLRDAFDKYKDAYAKKYKEAKEIIEDEEYATDYINRKFLELQVYIDNYDESSYYNKSRITKDLLKLKAEKYYTNIRDKSWVDNRITSMISELETK